MTQPAFSTKTHFVVVVKAADLLQLTEENQTAIMNKINDGYAKNHAKFNTLEGNRIKDLENFAGDSGFAGHLNESYMYLYAKKDSNLYKALTKQADIKKETFDDYEIIWITKDVDSEVIITENAIDGCVGFKPHHSYPDGKTIEPTCFVSFLPRLGSSLLPLGEKHFATIFDVEQYIVEVFVEHNLKEYYGNYHNYTEIRQFHIPIDYSPEETGLEPGIIFKQPMNMSVMVKKVKKTV